MTCIYSYVIIAVGTCETKTSPLSWRGVRVVDGDALEMRFGATQRGFESPPLR